MSIISSGTAGGDAEFLIYRVQMRLDGVDAETKLMSFTPREIAQLMATRSQSVGGELDDNIREYTRFRFAIWLYQHSQSS